MDSAAHIPGRPWHFIIPAILVAGGILPSFVMLAVARDVRVAKADLQPYANSAHIDSDEAIKAHLAQTGFLFAVNLVGQHVTARISGPQRPTELRLDVYRPDDATADASFAWPDSTEPLSLALSRPGRWRIRLSGTVDGVRARLADTAIDTTMAAR